MTDKKTEIKEVTISTSLGGKLQLVQYEKSADYHVSMTEKYEVSGLSDKELRDFEHSKIIELREHLEPIAQAEVDELEQQKDDLN